MDPVFDPNAYDIEPVLTQVYGKEKASEYYQMFNDCLQDKELEVNGIILSMHSSSF